MGHKRQAADRMDAVLEPEAAGSPASAPAAHPTAGAEVRPGL
jgi:hypothetical protein